MRAPIFAAILLLPPASACLLALPLHGGKASIGSVDPGTVIAGQWNVLILTGKNLSQVGGCELEPVSDAPATKVQCQAGDVQYISGSRQLKVKFKVPPTPTMNYVLTLTDAAGTTAFALTTIRAIGAMPVTAGQTSVPESVAQTQTSPFANCINASATPSPLISPQSGTASPAVNCASSLLTEGEVKDNFGQHVEHTYYAIQVRVSNQNANYDFLLRDILLTLPDGRVISGRIRRFAQGVAVKGKSLDRRAAFYNTLQATTGLYGGLTVFASAGFKTAGNVLQGAFLSGFAQIFPDYTADNVNRFNTAVFDDQNPLIVPKDSIGQPPLYVVALVPKNPASSSDPSHFGERIAVSIEGTYIKQVSLVSIAPSNIDFGLEFISPKSIEVMYGGKPSAGTSDSSPQEALQSQGKSMPVTITNNNSTVMNISKITVVADAKSSNEANVQDFSIDLTQGTCAKDPASGKIDPNSAFTIPAQGLCKLYVQFHPAGTNKSSASLVIAGDNLDGSKSVALTGTGVGLVYDTRDITVDNKSVNQPSFVCSYQNQTSCTLDVGTVDFGNNSNVPLSVPIILVGSAPGPATQVTSKQGTISPASCREVSQDTLDKTPLTKQTCTVTLELAKGSPTSTPLEIDSSNPVWGSIVTIKYHTDATEIDPTSPTGQLSLNSGASMAFVGVVNDVAADQKQPVTSGVVEVHDETGKLVAKSDDLGATKGMYSIQISATASHTYTLSYAANGKYESSPAIPPISVTITGSAPPASQPEQPQPPSTGTSQPQSPAPGAAPQSPSKGAPQPQPPAAGGAPQPPVPAHESPQHHAEAASTTVSAAIITPPEEPGGVKVGWAGPFNVAVKNQLGEPCPGSLRVTTLAGSSSTFDVGPDGIAKVFVPAATVAAVGPTRVTLDFPASGNCGAAVSTPFTFTVTQ